MCRTHISICIAHLADELDLIRFSQIKESVIPFLTRLLAEATVTIRAKLVFRRKVKVKETEREEILCIRQNNDYWSLHVLLNAMHNLILIDCLKQPVYFEENWSRHLRTIIYNGNPVEREFAFIVLSQFCFDSRIALDVRNDTHLLSFIQKEASDKSIRRQVKEKANELLCILGELHVENEKTLGANKEGSLLVLLSVNVDELNDLPGQIRNDLLNAGYQVLVVRDRSDYKSKIEVIKNVSCVLMCLSEMYKQDNWCRFEVEYMTARLDKPIIPLNVQKGFKNLGWCGML